MADKEFNINDDLLNIKKKILNTKEKNIMKSQICQNKLEKKIGKLKLKKKNIIRTDKWEICNIINTFIYDATMIIPLIILVIYISAKYNLMLSTYKTLYVMGVAFGMTTISVLWAYLSSSIRGKIECFFREARISKISRRIRNKEMLLCNEIDKQENIKKEITNIMNDFDSRFEINNIENRQDLISYKINCLSVNDKQLNEKSKYVRKRTKNR